MKNKRQANIELLRVLSMLFIVIWHCILHGIYHVGTEKMCLHYQTNEGNDLLLHFMLYVTSIAVNCYVLITGYFMVASLFHWSKVCRVWTLALFYSGIIAIGIYLFYPHAGLDAVSVLKSCWPLEPGSGYWFVGKYLALLALSPYLSRVALSLSKKEYLTFLLILVMLNVSLGYYFPFGRIYSGSMSLLWFIFLFFVAGYIRLFQPFQTLQSKYCIQLFIILCIGTALYQAVLDYYGYYKSGKFEFDIPPFNGIAFFLSLLLFMWALRLNISKRGLLNKCILFVAPYTFGVYLIHDNNIIRSVLWNDWLHLEDYYSKPYLAIIIVLVCILIFVFCAFIDFFRAKIFNALSVDRRVYSILEKGVKKIVEYLNTKKCI